MNLVKKLEEKGIKINKVVPKSVSERDIFIIKGLELDKLKGHLENVFMKEGFKIDFYNQGRLGGNFIAKSNGDIYSIAYSEFEDHYKITEFTFS